MDRVAAFALPTPSRPDASPCPNPDTGCPDSGSTARPVAEGEGGREVQAGRTGVGQASSPSSAAHEDFSGPTRWPSGQWARKSHQVHSGEVRGANAGGLRRHARRSRRRPVAGRRRSTPPRRACGPATPGCGCARPPRRSARGAARPGRSGHGTSARRRRRRGRAAARCGRRRRSARPGWSCSRPRRSCPPRASSRSIRPVRASVGVRSDDRALGAQRRLVRVDTLEVAAHLGRHPRPPADGLLRVTEADVDPRPAARAREPLPPSASAGARSQKSRRTLWVATPIDVCARCGRAGGRGRSRYVIR